MSYLRFDKTLMTDLEESLQKEVLRTNKAGAYHCTTIVDCNTYKYHRLLIISVSNIDDENYVLLSSLDETAIQHGTEFNLGLHRYQGSSFSPSGHKYIRELDCERILATTYRVGGVVLRKRKIFVHREDGILVRYTLLGAHSATTLHFRPFLASRNVRKYTHEDAQAGHDYQLMENGIKTCIYSGYPGLFMQLSKACEFHFRPDWYRGFEYPKGQEQGYDFNEDLYVPGYFGVDIKRGESIVFSAGTSEVTPRRLKQTFKTEMADYMPRDSFYYCLKNPAHRFRNQQGGEHYILAGYPWFKCRTRDMFVSLPGLTLALDEVNQFEDVMKTTGKAIRSFINDEPTGYRIYEMERPDVLLWAVQALQQYVKETFREQYCQKCDELLKDIIEFIRQRRHKNLFLHENGLLYANGTDKAITWMNSTVNRHPMIPRTGCIVEFNTLWYNALRFVANLIREDGDVLLADALDAQAGVMGKSFIKVFRSEYGYLLDYVNGDIMGWSVYPDMISSVTFDYPPLDRAQEKQILDVATGELLTPKGLRTLSLKSGGCNPNYVGPQIQRDYACHQDTARPQLMGFYMKVYLRIYRTSGLLFIERQLIGFEDELTIHCINSLPELFNGNPPFRGRGVVSFIMNVAEVPRILKLLSKHY